MDLPKLEHDIIGRLRSSVSIEPRGLNDYRIALPFTYPDGDCIKIILKRNADSWELTDEGHTSMFLSYYNINLARAAQSSFLETVLTSHYIEDNDGRFVMHGIANGDIAGAVLTFAQGLLRISDLSLWNREVSKRNFKEDFRQAVTSGVKGREIVFDYYDKAHDTQRAYPIDSMVMLRNRRQLYIFGVNSDEKAHRAMVSIYYLREYTPYIPTCIIYAGETNVGGVTRSKVNDVADKTLSSLEAAPLLETFIAKYEIAG